MINTNSATKKEMIAYLKTTLKVNVYSDLSLIDSIRKFANLVINNDQARMIATRYDLRGLRRYVASIDDSIPVRNNINSLELLNIALSTPLQNSGVGPVPVAILDEETTPMRIKKKRQRPPPLRQEETEEPLFAPDDLKDDYMVNPSPTMVFQEDIKDDYMVNPPPTMLLQEDTKDDYMAPIMAPPPTMLLQEDDIKDDYMVEPPQVREEPLFQRQRGIPSWCKELTDLSANLDQDKFRDEMIRWARHYKDMQESQNVQDIPWEDVPKLIKPLYIQPSEYIPTAKDIEQRILDLLR
jgi:hypothetical protein